MTTQVEREDGRGFPQGDVTEQPQVQRQELGKALVSINRYLAADGSYDHRGYGQQEVDMMNKARRDCLQVLCGIEDPLVQAIAAKLNLERHLSNATPLIRKLADRVAA